MTKYIIKFMTMAATINNAFKNEGIWTGWKSDMTDLSQHEYIWISKM